MMMLCQKIHWFSYTVHGFQYICIVFRADALMLCYGYISPLVLSLRHVICVFVYVGRLFK